MCFVLVSLTGLNDNDDVSYVWSMGIFFLELPPNGFILHSLSCNQIHVNLYSVDDIRRLSVSIDFVYNLVEITECL